MHGHAGIARGECGAALSAGVNAMLSPKTAVKICQLQVLGAGWCFILLSNTNV